MQLLRHLLSAAARFNFTSTAQHIPGIHNNIADAVFLISLAGTQVVGP